MATAGKIPSRRPRRRKLSGRGIVFAVAGKELPFPVYRFSSRRVFERPNHNPFRDNPPADNGFDFFNP